MWKVCPECGREFKTYYRKVERCSQKCAGKQRARRMAGRKPAPQAYAAFAALKREEWRAQFREDFGDLSERELAIVRRAKKLFYEHGRRATLRGLGLTAGRRNPQKVA